MDTPLLTVGLLRTALVDVPDDTPITIALQAPRRIEPLMLVATDVEYLYFSRQLLLQAWVDEGTVWRED